jgi:ribosome-interacting GTPase 1
MPTNLPPEAKDKWAEVEAARNPEEKLRLLQEFLSLVPQHKGTLKLRGQIKKKMSVLRREIEEKKQRKTGKGGPKFFVEKEGAAQIVLLGLTKTGKSSLLSKVTNAKAEVSHAPFTTRTPIPAIMNYQDVQFQLVEAPALFEGASEGRGWGLQTLALARNADGLILMVDLASDPVAQLTLILSELEKARILLRKSRGNVEVERHRAGTGLKLILTGKLVDCTLKQVEALLRSYRVTDATVKITGEVALDDVEDAIFESTVLKPAIIVANKIDLEDATDKLKALMQHSDKQVPLAAVSCITGQGLETLGSILFETLGLIRVYTKEPGSREVSQKPFTLKKGATLLDLARRIHSDFEKDFAFARIWSTRLAYSPQKAGLNFQLEDGDVVEIHIKLTRNSKLP